MPGTVDDFMNRFGGGGTIDDSQAQQYHDRFVSTDPNDRDYAIRLRLKESFASNLIPVERSET